MTRPLPLNPLDPGIPFAPVGIPGSKSIYNRALLLAAQAPGPSRLAHPAQGEDAEAMRRCLEDLGIPVQAQEGAWRIGGGAPPRPRGDLWVGASGTTFRFLLPWLALQAPTPVRLRGEARLFERPQAPLVRALESLGARWTPEGSGGVLHPAPPVTRLDLEVDAALSSQFLTGLALAASGLPGGGRLAWRGTASPSYLRLSAHWMARFGCVTDLGPDAWEIPGSGLRPADLAIPGDWSGAAAFLCAAALTGRPLAAGPLDPLDPQGDKAILDILGRAGCAFAWEGDVLQAEGRLARGLDADLEDCPDLAPVLAATAALAPGPSRLSGLHTLPHKECDRLEASMELIRWLGATCEYDGDALRVRPAAGAPPPPRPPFDPRGDHRMAFAAAVGGLLRGGALQDPGCVAKTFPAFWETWEDMLRDPG